MSAEGGRRELGLVVAIGRNGAIGKHGQLPWAAPYPEDRAHFEATVRGHVVIMGRRTWEEAGAPFGLRSIVVSRSLRLPSPRPSGVWQVGSLDEALALAWTMDPRPFVIGGAPLFLEALPRATWVSLTEVPEAPEGADTFLRWDLSGFHETERRASPDGLVFRTLERR